MKFSLPLVHLGEGLNAFQDEASLHLLRARRLGRFLELEKLPGRSK